MLNHQASVPKTDLFKVAFWVIALSSMLILPVYATWVTIDRLPIPDDDAINLGLIAFFGVVFLDVFFIFYRVAFDAEDHRGMPGELAVNAVLFAGGVLLAAFLGLGVWSVWSAAYKIQALPWAGQVNQVIQILMTLGFICLVWWRSRRPNLASFGSAQLRFLLCVLILFAGSHLFRAIIENDQEWFKVWRLVVGFLLIVPIARIVMEIARKKRERNPVIPEGSS